MAFGARTATELKNRWRGFQPWPGAFTALEGKKLIVHKMQVVEGPGQEAEIAGKELGKAGQKSGPVGPEPGSAAAKPGFPGQIVVENHRLLVRCAEDTWLELLEVQLEGKKRLSAAEFLRGAPLAADARLG